MARIVKVSETFYIDIEKVSCVITTFQNMQFEGKSYTEYQIIGQNINYTILGSMIHYGTLSLEQFLNEWTENGKNQ